MVEPPANVEDRSPEPVCNTDTPVTVPVITLTCHVYVLAIDDVKVNVGVCPLQINELGNEVITGSGLIEIVTDCAAPTHDPADDVGVTSKVTLAKLPEVLTIAATPVKVNDKLPEPV